MRDLDHKNISIKYNVDNETSINSVDALKLKA